jgi:hypothetical protein
MPAFQYRLILKDGTPADPPKFETATPQWREGDTFFTRPGRTFRIVAIKRLERRLPRLLDVELE